MKRSVILYLLSFLLFAGCAQICEFGKGEDSSGLKCFKLLAQAKIGMTTKEVEKTVGLPQKRQMDMTYRGKVYEEAWIYSSTPPTILYFKNGVLEHKEYQQ